MRDFQKTKQKKVGILTFHNGFNCGAYLQALAVQEILKEMGHRPQVIDYKAPLHSFYEYWYLFFTKRPRIFLGNLVKVFKFKRAHCWFRLSRAIAKISSLDKLEYDAVIYGSDEIWNYSNSIVKIDLAYYGIGIKAEKKIAFAASCGSLDKDSEVPGTIQKGWRSLSSISVRDENSRDLVARFVENPIDIALDPTFLFDFSPYEKNCLKENFILVYTTGFSSELQQKVKDYAKAKGKKLISIGYADTFCDENIIGIGPFEFLGYFKAASEVITNTLHGTIFAVKYNKPLAIISDSYRQNKLASIIEICELEEKILPVCGFGLEKCLSTSPDYIRINRKISMSAKSSKEFLKSALE